MQQVGFVNSLKVYCRFSNLDVRLILFFALGSGDNFDDIFAMSQDSRIIMHHVEPIKYNCNIGF